MVEGNLLETKPDTKQHVQKQYDLDKPEKMEQSIKILEQWIKTQEYFTKKSYDRRYLEMLIYDTKGSIEKAKDKLEKRCIFRTVLPQFFEFESFSDFDELLADQIPSFPLSKLTKEHYRVLVLKCYDNAYFRKATFMEFFKICYIVYEYLKLHDLCAGYYFIIDFRDVSITEVISKLKLMEFKHWATFLLEAQGMRLKKLIYVTPSKTMEQMVRLVKPLFNRKMADRIDVIRDVDVLQQYVDKDILPIELGGTGKSLKDIKDDWAKVLSSKEFMDYYADMRNAKVDQNIKKIEKKDDFVELSGSFVTLDFD